MGKLQPSTFKWIINIVTFTSSSGMPCRNIPPANCSQFVPCFNCQFRTIITCKAIHCRSACQVRIDHDLNALPFFNIPIHSEVLYYKIITRDINSCCTRSFCAVCTWFDNNIVITRVIWFESEWATAWIVYIFNNCLFMCCIFQEYIDFPDKVSCPGKRNICAILPCWSICCNIFNHWIIGNIYTAERLRIINGSGIGQCHF